MANVKERKGAMLAKIEPMKNEKKKKAAIADEAKKLTKAEFDALPKSLQKELKEYR